MTRLRTWPIGAGVVTSYANAAVTLLANLVGIPLYIRLLGRDDYGAWLATAAITSYLGLVNLGMTQTIATRFGLHVAQGNEPEALRTIATGFWALVRVAWPLAATAVIMAYASPLGFLFRGVAEPDRIRAVVAVVAAGLLIELPFSVVPACLRAIGGIAAHQKIAAAQTIGRVIVAVGALAAGSGLALAIALQTAVNVGAHLGALRCLRRRSPALSLTKRRFSADLAARMRSPSRYYLLMQVSGAVALGSDQVVISALLGPGFVTPYGVAQRLVNTAIGLAAVLGANYGPSFLTSYGRADKTRLRELYREAVLLSIGSGAVMATALLLVGPLFIRHWVGDANYVGFATLAALVVLSIIQAALHPADALLTMTANHRGYALAALWEAVLSLALSIYLCHRLGVLGVALGSVVGRVLGAGPVMIAGARRLTRPSTDGD